MTKDEYDKVLKFRNAVDYMMTSASNPGRASAVIHDNSPGSPRSEMILAKMEVDAMLWDKPNCICGSIPDTVLGCPVHQPFPHGGR